MTRRIDSNNSLTYSYIVPKVTLSILGVSIIAIITLSSYGYPLSLEQWSWAHLPFGIGLGSLIGLVYLYYQENHSSFSASSH